MTAEQLQAARAAHWRQQQNPLLTLDDASQWLEQHPLCLYLPRRVQLPAPAPSFVEATLGRTQATPGADALAPAQALLTRLVAGGSVVALNLLGAIGEQPDFLVTQQALPYVLCLRADADWKHAPEKSSGHKVSPLVLELWKALDKEGALTAAQARESLGRELTEAAVLRGLGELWQGLRISPVLADAGQPVRWELLRVRHRDALATAGATGQVTALSLLVSIYLQSVYAAASAEIEIFLSPLASRSRVREAVRGLSATRQIQSLSMDAETYYFLEGGLPAFAEPPIAAQPVQTALPPPAIAPPRRPAAATRPAFPQKDREQRNRPAAATGPATRAATTRAATTREEKKPRWAEKPPSFAPTRSLPPRRAQDGGKSPAVPPRIDAGTPHRAARPGARPGSRKEPGTRPAAAREWKKPAWGGKPGAAGSSFPGARRFPPASGPGAGKATAGPQRPDRPARGGQQRPAPWGRSGPRAGGAGARSGEQAGAGPPFRPAQKARPDRASGQPRDRGRPPGRVATGASPAMNRPTGRPPASFRSNPGRSNPGRSNPGRSNPGRSNPGRSNPGRSNPGRSGPGRPGATVGPARSGPPASRPVRPGPPREGSRKPGRPPFAPSSRPAPSWPRTGTSSARPSGQPGRKPAGKAAGKPGKPPANFRGRKPARKQPGV